MTDTPVKLPPPEQVDLTKLPALDLVLAILARTDKDHVSAFGSYI